MEKSPQPFDVCVVCALHEEVRAFLEIVRQQCEGAIEERFSPRYHYPYRFATLKNDKDEPLSLHISWLPRSGPQEITLHLHQVLEECQPRIAIMTGICAGDPQHVQLGDLVVAERTFTYDNGKLTLDEDGRSVHLHDTMTYQLEATLLQFLGLFDAWKPLVASLQRPASLSQEREVACHIKAMASGSAVRADHPFEDVQAPVRGTVAIDMEGAAFSLVMSRHSLIPWLVVKGVCDYADRNKTDVYHDYAARASALYALSLIQAYVTNERLPQPIASLSSNQAGLSSVRSALFARDVFLPRLRRVLAYLLIRKTQLAIFMNGLNMVLGTVAFLAVIVALVIGKIAPDQFNFSNILGFFAYSLSALICCSELYVLAVYRQWLWLVGLLVVGAGVYLFNSLFLFGGYMIYLVAAIIPLVFSFGWFFISRRTITTRDIRSREPLIEALKDSDLNVRRRLEL